MGRLDKRLDAVERRLGGQEPVLIHVVYENAPDDEVLYTVTVPASEDRDPPMEGAAPEQGDRWGA